MTTCADMFAGLGGVSCGAEMAGYQVLWAGNHWRPAVDTHQANHPGTLHACQDLHTLDWTRVPRPDVLWASPACQGHSECAQPARAASKAVEATHDAQRATAWCVVQAANVLMPQAIVVENVPEFVEWVCLPAWLHALELLGYSVHRANLTASRWGVPQRRERIFFVCVRGRGAARATSELARRLADPVAAEPPIGPHIDLELGRWTPISKMRAPTPKQLAEGKPYARLRAETAQRRFGGQPCWLQHVSHEGVWGRSMSEPTTTITGANQHAIVRDGHYRLFSVRETMAAQSFPTSYRIPASISRTTSLKMIGNAVPPLLAAGILRHVEAVL